MNKRFFYALMVIAALAINVSCGDDDDHADGGNKQGQEQGSGTGETSNPDGTVSVRGIRFCEIAAGSFTHSEDGYSVRHTITKSYKLSECEITNAQYCEFLNACGVGEDGKLPATDANKPIIDKESSIEGEALIYDSYSEYSGDYNWGCRWDASQSKWIPESGYEIHPVIYVTWYGAKAFCLWLGGDLPTEAQWELACQGTVCSGANCWYWKNSPDGTKPVGTKAAGSNGLHDMLGNVWEWCNDWYSGAYYNSDHTDYTGPVSGYRRAYHGGSWNDVARFCTAGYRRIGLGFVNGCRHDMGFRACRP